MSKLTLVKRSQPICPACIAMQTALDGAGIPYDTIDITEQPDATERYDLTAVPVLLIDRDNGEQLRLTGVQPIDKITELMKEGD